MPKKHYIPPLSRFLVCALHHEAKARGVPMTKLAQQLVEAGLRDTPGWQMAQAQQQERGHPQVEERDEGGNLKGIGKRSSARLARIPPRPEPAASSR